MKLVFLLLPLICQAVEEETQQQPIQQDEAQDRFVDLSVDVSYGLPQLGYVYNGLHLRGPRTPRREGRGTQFSNYVRHTRFAPSKTAEGNSFQPNFDFESDFNTIKESLKSGNEGDVYQTAYVTPTPQATYEEPAAYQEPAQVYQEPQVEYEQPAQVYQEPEPAYEEPAVTTTTYAPPTHSDKYSQPPYVPPQDYSVTDAYYVPSTKPPLHIKIQQDLQGLMDGMKSMLGQQNKQGSSGLGGLGGVASLPKPPKFNFRMPSLPQAPGKPPLMEKLRQDIFSMFPSSSKSSSSYSVPVVTYKPNTPAYETPEPEVSYNAPEPSYSAPSASYETYSPPTSSLFQVDGKPHLMEKIKQDILSLFPKPASSSSSSYAALSPSYSEPEEPQLYSPPNQPRVAREPLLSKFMKDFSKVNNWLARQTLEVANNGVPFEMPFDLPEIPELPNIQKIKREDSEHEGVMTYIPAPDLSKEQEDTEDDL